MLGSAPVIGGDKSALIRKVLACGLLVVLLASVVTWYFTVDRIPEAVTLYSGAEGGLYHRFALELKERYESRTGKSLRVVTSAGSTENREALLEGKADLAVVQASADFREEIPLICPLYPEVVHVVVRQDSDVNEVLELRGKTLVLGAPGSGMRLSAQDILKQYGLLGEVIEKTNSYFKDLLIDPSLDGAIVTTGIFNPDLEELMQGGQFRLLPIRGAGAVHERYIHLSQHTLPFGMYGMQPPVPTEDLPGLATTAMLAGNDGLSKQVLQQVLESIYEGGLRYQFPSLHRKEEALSVSPGPLAREAELYFNPSDRIGQMANILESVAAFKELLFALAAGLYLLWGRFKSFELREKAAQLQKEKDQLDALLTETMRLEQAQMRENDVDKLRGMLDEVTRIKLKALQRLTDEGLRGDRVFLIFLTQCAGVIAKIQARIEQEEARTTD